MKNKSLGEPRWICSVAALPYTDLVASGSSDGYLRLWKVAQDWKSLDQIAQYKLVSLKQNYSLLYFS